MPRNLLILILSLLFLSCSGGGDLNNSSSELNSTSPTLEITDTPTVSGSTPTSPAINNNPTIDGLTEPNSQVQIFTDSSCSILVGTGIANASGVFSVSVSLLGGESRSYFARATAQGKSLSECSSSSVTYKSNSIRPGLAWFSGTQTTAPVTPTKLNQAISYAILWSSSEFDSNYYTHSTSTNSEIITINQAGDYWISVTLPMLMTAGTYRPCVRMEIRKNGVLIPGAIGESGYIRFDPAQGNYNSSDHYSALLESLNVNDTIEVSVIETAGEDGTEVVQVSSQASLLLEYVESSRAIFTGTASRTVGSATNINLAASEFQWSQSRIDTGVFTHSAAPNPENIIFDQNGDYLVTLNIPITSTVQRAGPLVRLKINGTVVEGGEASQGYIRGDSGHNDSSIHWSGLIRGVTATDVLTITSERGAQSGVVSVQGGDPATITIEKVDTSSNVISVRGNTLSGGNNWNPVAAEDILWDVNDFVIDSNVFSHSILSTQNQITVNEQGDYLLVYSDSLSGSTDRLNPLIKVQVNGTNVPGAEANSHYIRNADGHNESSASLVFLLRNLSVGDIVSVNTVEDVNSGTMNDVEDALLTLIKK